MSEYPTPTITPADPESAWKPPPAQDALFWGNSAAAWANEPGPPLVINPPFDPLANVTAYVGF